MVEEIKFIVEGKEPHPVEELRKELQHLMWKKAGIIRSKKVLSGLVDDIERLKEKLAGSVVKDWKN